MDFQTAYNRLFALLPEMAFSEQLVVWTVLRQTYGWHKETDVISYSQFERFTGLSRQAISDGIQAALARGVLGRRAVGSSFEYWLVLPVDQPTAAAVDNSSYAGEGEAVNVENGGGGSSDYPQPLSTGEGPPVYPLDTQKKDDPHPSPSTRETLLSVLAGIDREIRAQKLGTPFYDVRRLAAYAERHGRDAGEALELWNAWHEHGKVGVGFYVDSLKTGEHPRGEGESRERRRVVEEFRRALASG